MTYDVQRWEYVGKVWYDEDGPFVLAADAEAHEKAAVDAVISDFLSNHGDRHIREQAIRDCIAAVEFLHHHNPDQATAFWYAIAELRALLEQETR